MSGSMSYTLDRAAIQRLMTSRDSDLARYLLRKAHEVRGRAVLFVSGDMVNVDTGRLRSSLTAGLKTFNGQPAGVCGTNVSYAIYLLHGTRYIAPRPFLQTALRDAMRA